MFDFICVVCIMVNGVVLYVVVLVMLMVVGCDCVFLGYSMMLNFVLFMIGFVVVVLIGIMGIVVVVVVVVKKIFLVVVFVMVGIDIDEENFVVFVVGW